STQPTQSKTPPLAADQSLRDTLRLKHVGGGRVSVVISVAGIDMGTHCRQFSRRRKFYGGRARSTEERQRAYSTSPAQLQNATEPEEHLHSEKEKDAGECIVLEQGDDDRAHNVQKSTMRGLCKLSPNQEASLRALNEWVNEAAVDLTPLVGDGVTCPAEDRDVALMRYLRHNKWDVEKTRIQVEENLEWRLSMDMADLLVTEPWRVVGCADAETFDHLCRSYYPHYFLPSDRQGRPVLVQKYGNFDTGKLKECATLEGLVRYHAWEQEKNSQLLRRTSLELGRLVETYTLILDFKGMGFSLVNPDFLWLLRSLSDMDRSYFPGRGGVTFVINTPPLFNLVWQGIRGFMERTQARIHIFSSEKGWKAALREAIDPAHLPLDYGGLAPPLSSTPFLPNAHQALLHGSKGPVSHSGASPSPTPPPSPPNPSCGEVVFGGRTPAMNPQVMSPPPPTPWFAAGDGMPVP
ncbi:unnamed protein product, partial [Discosporangium mesarthrocarpum]